MASRAYVYGLLRIGQWPKSLRFLASMLLYIIFAALIVAPLSVLSIYSYNEAIQSSNIAFWFLLICYLASFIPAYFYIKKHIHELRSLGYFSA
jgi:hypothetical protein